MSIERWDVETDVVVIGAGLAGYCAALEAAAKADVVLIEKLLEAGGTSAMSGGLFAFAGTDLQRSRGIEDTEERLFDDLRRVGAYQNDERLVRAYVEHQLNTYDWLRRQGVVFGHPEASSGQSVPRSHPTKSRVMIDCLARAAAAAPRIRLMTGTPVRRLIRDGASGPVEGIVAQRDGKPFAVRARRGVIVASGGFSRNEKLLRAFAPMQVGVNAVCGKGCTGDGLLMAWRLGADLRDMAYVKSTFGNHPDSGSERHLLLFPVYRGAIAVNKKGRRFVDESLSYKLLGDACLLQPDAMAYQVFDRTVMEKTAAGVLTFDFHEALEAGLLIEAQSVEQLAEKTGIDPPALATTIARYNHCIDRGLDDEFGRRALSNEFGALVKIETPPYYAYPSVNVLLGTYAGIAVNSEMQVIDVFDEPIARLYAAGEVHGGFHGAAYMTGSGLGKAAIFGRVAGRNAARGGA